MCFIHPIWVYTVTKGDHINKLVAIIIMSTKKYILAAIWIIIVFPLFAQSQWTWQNPLPQGNSLLNLYFINQDIGYFVGTCGTIVKTADGGESWNLQESGTNLNLTSIHFYSNNIGFACGGNKYSDDSLSVILKTIDGGNNWQIIYQDALGQNKSVFCISPDTALVVGVNGKVLRTDDAGNSWQNINTGIIDNFCQITFPSPSIGFIISRHGFMIKSTDGGITWKNVELNLPPPDARLTSVSFPTINTGYVLFYNNGPGEVLKTTNSGTTWTTVLSNTVSAYSMDFYTEDIGYITGAGRNYKTVDGGQTWELPDCFYLWDNQIDVTSPEIMYGTVGREEAYATNAKIYKSIDGGFNWKSIINGFANGSLNNIDFTGPHTGYFSAYSLYGPNMIMKTTDGNAWDTIFHADTIINDMYILNEEDVFFCGSFENPTGENSGMLGYSFNGGGSWNLIDLGNALIPLRLHFSNNSVGFLMNYSQLYKTINSGSSWEVIHTDTVNKLFQIYFTSENTGYLLKNILSGDHALVFKSEDAGESWNQISQFNNQSFQSGFFVNDEKGYLLASYQESSILYFTQNGGTNWQSDTFDIKRLSNLHFLDDSVGWIVGVYGDILNTTDGGNSWNINNMITNNPLYDVHFVDYNTGYIAGWAGTLLKTTNGGVTFINDNNNATVENILNIYPNPCSRNTNLCYSLRSSSQVTVKIHNLNGQYLRKILDKKQNPGRYKIQLTTNDLVSGIYIVHLKVNNKSFARKLIVQ